MTEENKTEAAGGDREKPPETAETRKADAAARIEEQEKKVEALAKALEEKDSASLRLELDRETDLLHHLRQVEKGDAKERATLKANYAAKAARRRAIQPIDN